METKFTKTITINNDDLKKILIEYLSLSDYSSVRFNVVNKPKPHPYYLTDTVDNWILDGVTISVSCTGDKRK